MGFPHSGLDRRDLPPDPRRPQANTVPQYAGRMTAEATGRDRRPAEGSNWELDIGRRDILSSTVLGIPCFSCWGIVEAG